MTKEPEKKEKPIRFSSEMVRAILDGRKTQTRRVMKPQPTGIRESPFVQSGIEDNHGYEIKCPYGQPGDRLWVRESWSGNKPFAQYRATDEGRVITHWQPSIHMSRWASRIDLLIKNIRVERVQDITDSDAISEGIKPVWDNDIGPRDVFSELWDDLNTKKGYGWDANPLVWVIEFEMIKPKSRREP